MSVTSSAFQTEVVSKLNKNPCITVLVVQCEHDQECETALQELSLTSDMLSNRRFPTWKCLINPSLACVSSSGPDAVPYDGTRYSPSRRHSPTSSTASTNGQRPSPTLLVHPGKQRKICGVDVSRVDITVKASELFVLVQLEQAFLSHVGIFQVSGVSCLAHIQLIAVLSEGAAMLDPPPLIVVSTASSICVEHLSQLQGADVVRFSQPPLVELHPSIAPSIKRRTPSPLSASSFSLDLLTYAKSLSGMRSLVARSPAKSEVDILIWLSLVERFVQMFPNAQLSDTLAPSYFGSAVATSSSVLRTPYLLAAFSQYAFFCMYDTVLDFQAWGKQPMGAEHSHFSILDWTDGHVNLKTYAATGRSAAVDPLHISLQTSFSWSLPNASIVQGSALSQSLCLIRCGVQDALFIVDGSKSRDSTVAIECLLLNCFDLLRVAEDSWVALCSPRHMPRIYSIGNHNGQFQTIEVHGSPTSVVSYRLVDNYIIFKSWVSKERVDFRSCGSMESLEVDDQTSASSDTNEDDMEAPSSTCCWHILLLPSFLTSLGYSAAKWFKLSGRTPRDEDEFSDCVINGCDVQIRCWGHHFCVAFSESVFVGTYSANHDEYRCSRVSNFVRECLLLDDGHVLQWEKHPAIWSMHSVDISDSGKITVQRVVRSHDVFMVDQLCSLQNPRSIGGNSWCAIDGDDQVLRLIRVNSDRMLETASYPLTNYAIRDPWLDAKVSLIGSLLSVQTTSTISVIQVSWSTSPASVVNIPSKLHPCAFSFALGPQYGHKTLSMDCWTNWCLFDEHGNLLDKGTVASDYEAHSCTLVDDHMFMVGEAGRRWLQLESGGHPPHSATSAFVADAIQCELNVCDAFPDGRALMSSNPSLNPHRLLVCDTLTSMQSAVGSLYSHATESTLYIYSAAFWINDSEAVTIRCPCDSETTSSEIVVWRVSGKQVDRIHTMFCPLLLVRDCFRIGGDMLFLGDEYCFLWKNPSQISCTDRILKWRNPVGCPSSSTTCGEDYSVQYAGNCIAMVSRKQVSFIWLDHYPRMYQYCMCLLAVQSIVAWRICDDAKSLWIIANIHGKSQKIDVDVHNAYEQRVLLDSNFVYMAEEY
eukprot:ANDGO_03824.mRNA.1 hypothetical protein